VGTKTKDRKKAELLAAASIIAPMVYVALCGWFVFTKVGDMWSDDWWGFTILAIAVAPVSAVVCTILWACWKDLSNYYQKQLTGDKVTHSVTRTNNYGHYDDY
jgi:hypothetical protein